MKGVETFLDLFGTWSQDDLDEFNRRNADLNRVDPSDWESSGSEFLGDVEGNPAH